MTAAAATPTTGREATVSGYFVLVRAEPGTSHPRIGRLEQGTRIFITCQRRGTRLSGPSASNSPWWNYITKPYRGWVSDAFVDSGPGDRAAPDCPARRLPVDDQRPTGPTAPPPPPPVETTGPTPPPPPPPVETTACKVQIGPQRVSIDFTRRSEFEISSKRDGKVTIKQRKIEVKPFGTLTFKASTCQHPRTGWAVNQSASVVVEPVLAPGIAFSDTTRTFAPLGDGFARGWGIQLYRNSEPTEPVIAVKGMHCKDGGYGKAVFVELLGLPLPLPYAGSVVQYAAQKAADYFIPDPKVKCADLGVETIRIESDENGCVRVRTNGRMNGSFTGRLVSPSNHPGERAINTVRGGVFSSVTRYHGSTKVTDPDCRPRRSVKRLRGGPQKD